MLGVPFILALVLLPWLRPCEFALARRAKEAMERAGGGALDEGGTPIVATVLPPRAPRRSFGLGGGH